ncbi:elongation factor G [Catenibacillus scindens]|uniref:Elongation factor G n=1 Tax=Catenibacillus scindens TaxID=673271 RepID=A0A7W8HBB8_9FIRM|nr:elongation factor G [Catenibacillus scindens]MBB5265125.1 elongation factor G [Catenibacillus scindens]
MKVYKTQDIRNVAILGHGGCGKTTLVEAMAYAAGVTKRQGKVDDGNTLSDYDKEEIRRKFSISTTVIPIEWEYWKINLLDTPGYMDFVGEVEEALSVADAAIIVVSAKSGVEAGTIKAWNYCEKYSIPRTIFVTNMDDEHADYMGVVNQLRELYGKKIAPFHLPIREDGKFTGAVNVVKMEGRKFTDSGKWEARDIPDDVEPELETCREALLEAVAETSEELMDKYFGGEEFTIDEIIDALRINVNEGSIVPVQCGSGLLGYAIANLITTCVEFLPSPMRDHIKIFGKDPRTDKEYNVDYDSRRPFSAYVFKTIVDPFIGRYSLVKVCSGELKNDSVIYNYAKDTEEKLSKLFVMRGKELIEVPELKAGDIGAIAKLSNTATGDTLSLKSDPLVIDQAEISAPYTYKRYEAKNKGDEDKVSQALSKMMEEDLTLRVFNDAENHQSLLYGIGDQQLDVVVSKLLAKYKVEIVLSKPRIPYRETIRKKVSVREKYKKQSGGHGQYGDVAMEFEPSGDLEKPYVFEERVVGGAVPKNYFPAVEKGIAESVNRGPLAGYPVVGIKATLFDGSYHPVDSSEMAFKTAAKQAFKSAFLQASPILLEPIASLSVYVPDSYTGDIMGDLNKRRGRVLGMNPSDFGRTEIVADIPLAQLYGYSTDLRSMTGGRGDFAYSFSRYEQAPSDVQDKVIAENAKENEN